MAILLLGLGLFALLVWAGRRPGAARGLARWGSGLSAGILAIGAVASGMRGLWIVSLVLMALSAYLARRARLQGRPVPPRQPPGGMGRAEARAILGVGEGASRAEIESAYRRLIRFAHPDRGGSPGLAAQLNAARDLLAKG